MEEWEEAPVATGPTKSSYSPGYEQAQRMEGHLGSELNRKLEIMAAKLEIIKKMRAYCKEEIETASEYPFVRDYKGVCILTHKHFLEFLKDLEQEIKAELK